MRIDIGDGTRLFFDVIGAGWEPAVDHMAQRPTLVCLHGGPGFDHSSFRPSFDVLADVAQVVLVDHHSQGRSDDRPRDQWTLDVWADDVRRFCDALDIENPIVLGNSFGGMVAMHYAARHPDHPGAVVLSSTAAYNDVDTIATRFRELSGEDRPAELARKFFSGVATPEEAIEYLEVCGPYYTTSDGNVLDSPYAVRRMDVTAHFFEGENETFDLRPGLADIAAPTLLLAGALDPVCPIEGMREIADAIDPALATLEVFDDCGHGVFRDDPARAFDSLRAFIGGL